MIFCLLAGRSIPMKTPRAPQSELRQIPGVGEKIEQDLIALGYTTLASLRGQDPEEMYLRDGLRRGHPADRCLLYVFRCAVYFAETPDPEPEKLNWWYWKDPVK